MINTKKKIIISIILLTLIATVSTSGFSIVYMFNKMSNNTNDFLMHNAKSYGHELNGVIIGMETTVDSLTNSVIGIIDKNRINEVNYYAELSNKLENIASQYDNNDINAMSVYIRFDPKISYGTAGVFHSDTDGDGTLERLTPTNLNLYDVNDREHVGWFYEPVNAKKPIWTEPYFNANVGIDMISYISPISIDGVIIGVVGVDINFNQLRDITNNNDTIGKVIILDTKKRFLVHDTFSITDDVSSIDDGRLAYIEDLLDSKPNGIIQYMLDDESKILGYSKLKNDWIVIVAMTTSEAFYKLNNSIFVLVIINSIIATIMIGLSVFLSIYLNGLITRNNDLEKMVEDRTKELIKTNEYLEESLAELENSQAELTILNEQLERSLEKVNEMQEYLIMSEKLSSMGELITGVAHEINTPLGNSITMISFLKNRTETIKEKSLSTELNSKIYNDYIHDQLESIYIIERSLIRLKELVDSFKLITLDKTMLDIKLFKPFVVLTDLVTVFEKQLSEGNHKINIYCDDNLTLTTYPIVFQQIFKQLISNSIIHGFDNMQFGIIDINISMVEDKISIDYSDNGNGISKSLIMKVFEPFYTTRRNKGNAGLGLHIVHNLVTNSLNGNLSIDSDIGLGTRYHITFRNLL